MVIKLSDYLVSPKDLFFWLKRQRPSWRTGVGLGVLVIFTIVLVSHFKVFFIDILFIDFLLVSFYWDIDSRVSISLALACLVLVPILLWIATQTILPVTEMWPETAASWAFYFLCIGVVKQIYEYWKESHELRVTSKEGVQIQRDQGKE